MYTWGIEVPAEQLYTTEGVKPQFSGPLSELHSFVLALKWDGLRYLRELHSFMLGEEKLSDQWISCYELYDTMAYYLSRTHLQHVCDPSGCCWREAYPLEVPQLDAPDELLGVGHHLCMRCLRTWCCPAFYEDRSVMGHILKVPLDPGVVQLGSMILFRTVTDTRPWPEVDVLSQLNWYSAIYPEFYQDLFIKYQWTVFPVELKGQLGSWFEACFEFISNARWSMVWYHPTFQGISDAGANYNEEGGELQWPCLQKVYKALGQMHT
jgi:hypothetical protein